MTPLSLLALSRCLPLLEAKSRTRGEVSPHNCLGKGLRNLVNLFLSFRLQQVDKSAKVGQKWLQNSKLVARYKS